MNARDTINEYCITYAEWAEELGENFPQFLVFKLASDLCRERDRTQYLEKIAYDRFTH